MHSKDKLVFPFVSLLFVIVGAVLYVVWLFLKSIKSMFLKPILTDAIMLDIALTALVILMPNFAAWMSYLYKKVKRQKELREEVSFISMFRSYQ